MLCELAVPKSVHGAVYGDGWFAGCAWCPRGDRVAYVAEARARAPPPCRPAPAPRAVRARTATAATRAGARQQRAAGVGPLGHARRWQGCQEARCRQRAARRAPDLARGRRLAGARSHEPGPAPDRVAARLAASHAPVAHAAPSAPQEDWGETQTGKRAPALFVLDVAARRVTRVRGLPADASAAAPVWEPAGAPAAPPRDP